MKWFLIILSDTQFPLKGIKKGIKNILSEPGIRFCGSIDSSGELVVGLQQNLVLT